MRLMFTQSAETKRLVELFISMPVGSTLSFPAATQTLGFTVKSVLPAYQTAKRVAERDHNVVVEGIRGFGFMRINGSGMVSRAPRFFRKVRKGARREAHVQNIAISQNLTREEMMIATEQYSRMRILETTAANVKAPISNKRVVENPPT